jgi:hypothetical protein
MPIVRRTPPAATWISIPSIAALGILVGLLRHNDTGYILRILLSSFYCQYRNNFLGPKTITKILRTAILKIVSFLPSFKTCIAKLKFFYVFQGKWISSTAQISLCCKMSFRCKNARAVSATWFLVHLIIFCRIFYEWQVKPSDNILIPCITW